MVNNSQGCKQIKQTTSFLEAFQTLMSVIKTDSPFSERITKAYSIMKNSLKYYISRKLSLLDARWRLMDAGHLLICLLSSYWIVSSPFSPLEVCPLYMTGVLANQGGDGNEALNLVFQCIFLGIKVDISTRRKFGTRARVPFLILGRAHNIESASICLYLLIQISKILC